MIRNRRTALPISFILAVATTAAVVLAQAPFPRALQIPQELRERIERGERARVVVELNLSTGPFNPEAVLPDAVTVVEQRQAIAVVGARILSNMPAASYRVFHRYATVPHLALEVGPAALAALENSGADVIKVSPDEILRPVLAESVPLIEGDQAWAAGYDGSGTMVAIIDTGVDSTHPFLTGKVVEEACYSSSVPGTSQSVCPNGLNVQVGPGSAVPCPLSDCFHGTHVAGIAAGNGAGAGQSFSGVAKGAQLMAVQVFTKITSSAACGGSAPCLGAFTSDIIAGLERVYAQAWYHNLVAVNMSLGGQVFSAPCDSEPYKPIIDNLRAIGIATTVAAGNGGYTARLSTPACISSAISVGSTSKTDAVSWFSNVAPFLSLHAPGESITSSVPGGGYLQASGTSMAAPHVAGAWALLRQAAPNASVTLILQTLRQTGLPIPDTRLFGTTTIPRVRVFKALTALVPVTNPTPVITSLSPSRVRAGSGAFTLTITGSGFNAFSVARWNGAARPTAVISATQIQASIAGTDLPLSGAGTAEVRIFTPAPGGGTSSALAVTIDPAASLTLSAPVVAPGGAVTVTLANGYGGATDWLALAATSAPNGNYLQFIYVGGGVTNTTWTVMLPTSGGPFEFRLFLNNGTTRAATSPPVTVDPTFNPAPVLSSLSPVSGFVGGAAFTLTVNGSGFVAASTVRWNGAGRPTTFVSANQLQAAIGASDLAAAGTVPITVFTPAPGGGTSASLPFVIGGAAPSLAVSATTVAGGSTVTVTLTNAVGGATDWLALAAISAPDNSYLQWTYVGAGVTTRAWTVTMPASGGPFEFRLLLNNGYTRAATSPPIFLTPGAAVLTSLSPASAAAGGPAFTLTVNGSGFVAASMVRWNGANRPTTFISANQLQAAIAATDLVAPGSVPVTVFTPAPGGGTSASLPFVIGGAAPSLTVSATTVTGGSSVTVTLTNGAGGATDWLALAATTAPDTSYQQWTYVGAGVTTRTWTVTVPTSGGPLEFRLLLNNGFTRGATSPPISLLPGPAVLTSLSPASAAAGGAAFTLAVNGSGFVAASMVRWNGASRPTTFISANQLQAAIGTGDLVAAGTVPITVFTPAPGGGTSTSLPFVIGGAAPSLAVSATTVAGGSNLTMTLTNGAGGAADWLALAATSAPDNSYLQWTYVGAGVTTRTWTVTMPTSGGPFEFRLLLNNGYTRAATSPPVTVIP